MKRTLVAIVASLALSGCTVNVIVPPAPPARPAPAPPPPAKLVNPCGVAGMVNCNRPNTRSIA